MNIAMVSIDSHYACRRKLLGARRRDASPRRRLVAFVRLPINIDTHMPHA